MASRTVHNYPIDVGKNKIRFLSQPMESETLRRGPRSRVGKNSCVLFEYTWPAFGSLLR